MKQKICWRNMRQLTRQQLPDTVRPWLLDRGSLTARLIKASHGNFRVQLLEQSWRVPTDDEAALLNMKQRQKALVREVLLICNDEPWVYARSVIPFSSLQGPLRFLRKLQNSALGALLFKDPFLVRSHFEVADITLPNNLIPVENSANTFGRRSLFYLQNQPLLVAEIFLPACQLSQNPGTTNQLSLHGEIGL